MDLVASLGDGRVTREASIDMLQLDLGVWLIEGKPRWGTNGELLGCRTTFTEAMFLGVLCSLQRAGYWVLRSDGVDDTMTQLRLLEGWLAKDNHRGLTGRPGPRRPRDRDWKKARLIHVLQSVPGVGYDKAKKIVEACGGLPVMMKPGVDLEAIPGIGPKISEKVREIFG